MKTVNIMGKARLIFGFYLQEIKNEMISNPKTTALWIPRGLLDILAVFLTYRWMVGNLRLGVIAILTAALFFPFIIAFFQSYSRLFRDKRISFLLVAPTPFWQIMTEKWLEITAPSIELVFLLGTPLFLVIGKLPAGTAFFIFMALFFGILLSSLLGVATALMSARYLSSRRVLAVIGFIILIFSFSRFSSPNQNYPDVIWSNLVEKIYLIVFSQLLFITAFFSLLVIAGRRIEKTYFIGRSRILETKLSSKKARQKRLRLDIFKYAKGAVAGILAKEALLHWRNPMQWFRFFLTLTLFALYPVVRTELVTGDAPLFILAFNISFTVILVHIFINEVVINTFISEARRLSLMLVAPVSSGKIIFSKFVASLFLPLLVSIIGVTTFAFLAHLSRLNLLLSLLLVALINVGVVGVLVGLGASNKGLDKEITSYLDQFMIEQVFITNTKSVFILLAGTLVVLINLGFLLLAYVARGFSANLWVQIAYGTIFIAFNISVALAALKAGSISLKRV